MRIVFCKTAFAGPISGADEIAVMYALELKRAGHSSAILLVHPPASDDSLAVRLREANIPLTSLASPAFSASLVHARRFAIRAMRAFKPASQLILNRSRNFVFELMERYHEACCAYFKREKPDVVHVLTPDQGAMMLIRAAHTVGVPVIYQEVGIPFHPPGFERVYERFVSVLPSLTEGTPNAIIEAMAHQKPIVATPVGGIPDLVSEDVGMLVPPGDPQALSTALARLASDAELRRAMGIAARKRYEQLFAPNAVLPLLIHFYEGVAGKNGHSNNGKVLPAHPWF